MSDRRLLYAVEQLPVLQNRVYASAAQGRDAARGDMRLVQDTTTGLVFNEAFDPDLVHYDRHYNNEQSLSPAFAGHLDAVADIVQTWLGTRDLLEIGCGKGAFLQRLAARGCRIGGCDPTYEGSNPAVVREFYGPQLGLSGNHLILRHVLEHVRDPVGFLAMVAAANGPGRIYIEVPCFDWILARRAWFDIFYEHVNYFRLADFERMFGTVVAAGRLFGGQYLYAVAELSSLRTPAGGDAIDFPVDFLDSLDRRPRRDGEVIWGAASKGVIYALLRARRGAEAAAAVDVNPAKQGGHLPGTGLRVISPEECLSSVPAGRRLCVMNSNYVDEIRRMTRDRYSYETLDHAA